MKKKLFTIGHKPAYGNTVPPNEISFEDYVDELNDICSYQIENYIRVAIKPNPRGISKKLWYKLASKFLRIEVKECK